MSIRRFEQLITKHTVAPKSGGLGKSDWASLVWLVCRRMGCRPGQLHRTPLPRLGRNTRLRPVAHSQGLHQGQATAQARKLAFAVQAGKGLKQLGGLPRLKPHAVVAHCAVPCGTVCHGLQLHPRRGV